MSSALRSLSSLQIPSRSCHVGARLVSQIRRNSTYQPPTPPPSKDNPHRNFWKSFGRPIAKVFLGAMCTYQLAYLGWMKLESMEEKFDKDAEVRRLEAQLHELKKTEAVK